MTRTAKDTPHTSDELRKLLIEFDAADKSTDEKALQAFKKIEAKVLPRSTVEEAIGENEVFIDIPTVDHTGKVISVLKGDSYTPYMVARNHLRADIRQKLNLTKGDKDNGK